MQFNSFVFIFFLIAVTVFYYLTPVKKRNLVLLISNYIFYSYFDYRFSILLLGLTSSTYIIGNKILNADKYSRKRNLLILSVTINLVVLSFFKYFNFFTGSFTAFLDILGWESNSLTLNLLLPLGISFYVFQMA